MIEIANAQTPQHVAYLLNNRPHYNIILFAEKLTQVIESPVFIARDERTFTMLEDDIASNRQAPTLYLRKCKVYDLDDFECREIPGEDMDEVLGILKKLHELGVIYFH